MGVRMGGEENPDEEATGIAFFHSSFYRVE
jgi:hypothetical protein